jgi:catechol 2,3-dioxygenase-like lactoylglutathione lyase family enzyme
MNRTRKKSGTTNFFVAVVVLLGLAHLSAQTPAESPAQTLVRNPMEIIPSHATLSVSNLDTEVEWYERVMGFKVTSRAKRGDDFEVVETSIPGYRIDMSWRKGSVRHHVLDFDTDQGWMHIVFQSPALEADYNRLVALKADVKANKNKDGTIGRLIIHDPEGTEIEIQRPDQAGQAPAEASADNPLQLTPHHATVAVADYEKEVDWYQRVMGFTVTQQFKLGDAGKVCHLSIPGYQLDVSWHKGSVKHAILKGDLEQGWLHVVFKTRNIDAVYDRLVAEHTDVRAARDKDSKITMVSVDDPEGNQLAFQPAS